MLKLLYKSIKILVFQFSKYSFFGKKICKNDQNSKKIKEKQSKSEI